MQRLTVRKKVEGPKKKKLLEGGFWGCRLSHTFGVYGVDSGVRGGGKCPEEEHSI
jgi:hypothetical protein